MFAKENDVCKAVCARLLVSERGQDMILAVDFDGTLSFGEWPAVGPANYALIEYLKSRQMLGDKLILWTCRAGEALADAVDFCSDNGLEFDAINDNLPEITEKYGNNSRKISCDLYIDDRAVGYRPASCG